MKSLSTTKVCLLICTLFASNCSANDPTKIVIITNLGDIELQLYDQTPQHRDNFIRLVNEGFYDSTLFHRVIKGFMIQGGDPESKNAEPGVRLGKGSPGYTIPAEFVPEYFHKRGALAAARTNNPEKASSGSQFYIVQGKMYTDNELDQVEASTGNQKARHLFWQFVREEEDALQKAGQTVNSDSVQFKAERKAYAWLSANPFHLKKEHREVYKTIGGAPSLDTEYTVFGEVVKGMAIVDKITEQQTDNADRPIIDVKIIKMTVQ
jgi:cyclophilin family peptidyl-prolyl cis-trans isomerase